MLTRVTKIQLVAFLVVTALALGLMAANYVQIPAQLGFGRYDVTVQLAKTGGLYPKSVVTYRGHEIGQVTSLDLRPGGGVDVALSLDEDADVPKNSAVEVLSASVIGEQYLNFVPRKGDSAVLAQGDVIPADRTATPVSTDELITSAKTFLDSVPLDDLRTTIDELGQAFAGRGDDLGRLLDAGTSLQAEANANLSQTLSLIDDLAPVLATQQASDGDIRAWSGDLADFTGELAASDDSLKAVLTSGSPAAQQISEFLGGVQPVLPTLLTDLASTGQVLQTYLPNIEHVLTVLPAAIEGQVSVVPPETRDDEYVQGGLSFKLSVNDPPICTTGFEFSDKQRSPKDTSLAPLPKDSYCKVPKSDKRVVRGARNQACPNGGSAPTAAGCGLVFQADEVKRGRLLTGSDTATYDTESGRLLAPNGDFYLLDQLSGSKKPTTWKDLMTDMVTL